MYDLFLNSKHVYSMVIFLKYFVNCLNFCFLRYPIYQKGSPQLRVFLPNFWMKLVRPTHKIPSNVVQFACSMEMTKFDVKNYMEKIYNVKCVDVRTRIHMPKTRREVTAGYVIKDDDVKYAYVIMVRYLFTEMLRFKI